MGFEKKDEDVIYNALSNPLRRTILVHLYSNTEASAAELKFLTGVSYGTLYYHLDALKPFLKVVGRGRFRLNEEGVRIASRLIGASSDRIISNRISTWEALALGFTLSKGGVLAALIAGILLLFHAVFVSSILDLSPSLLHLRIGFNPLSWVVSVALVIAYMFVAFLLLKRVSGSAIHVLSASFLSYFPVALFLSIIVIFNKILGMTSPQLIVQAEFVISHVWQLAILAVGLTHATGAGYERSIPVVLLLSYLSLLSVQESLIPIPS